MPLRPHDRRRLVEKIRAVNDKQSRAAAGAGEEETGRRDGSVCLEPSPPSPSVDRLDVASASAAAAERGNVGQ